MSQSDPRLRLNDLWPLVYDNLRAYASRCLDDEPNGLTLQTTDLVHEVYLRLSELREINWRNDNEIRRASIAVMRRVLVDTARARRAQKRSAPGGKVVIGTHIDDVVDGGRNSQGESQVDVLDLDDAIERFIALDPRKAEVVQLRYFGGLSIEEIARLLEVSTATVKRDWIFAKAWLYRELRGSEHEET